ncbi:MAG: His/Gly/Thr/Pro-type tRNA ligase C-terminal domain-containing protein, partial [Planctomycetota bacterium]|nr:His/Gly/Thr/Pro-type tRNA ligase C-terminal domain-containing protein [Planctomycetota bacterium]
VFVIAAKEEGDAELKRLVASLRRSGYHVRHSYRATRNVGKLLGDAGKVRARVAVIMGDELGDGNVNLKNLDTKSEDTVALKDLESSIASLLNSQNE